MNKGKKKGPGRRVPVLKQSSAFLRRRSASSSRVPFEELLQLLNRCQRMGFDAHVVEYRGEQVGVSFIRQNTYPHARLLDSLS